MLYNKIAKLQKVCKMHNCSLRRALFLSALYKHTTIYQKVRNRFIIFASLFTDTAQRKNVNHKPICERNLP